MPAFTNLQLAACNLPKSQILGSEAAEIPQ